jgi:CHAT domain-containing protein
LLAFAPSFGNNKVLLSELKERGTDFSDLEGARDEVLQIEKEYGGKVFLDSAATLQNFLQYSPEYNVLHISTHGILNDEKPLESKLVFYKKNDSTESDLYIHDLFTMKLNANLVVLSACNTGFGKVADGEGIISLSGAFLYTGVSSLISTLWSVNDRSTAAIMRSFYSSVFNKEDKPEALRMAQLNYLSTADNLLAHPYYWAGFIAIGNDQPLHVSNVSTIVAILLTLSGIVILILFFVKHRRSKTT